jgi:hypothetical protein
VATAFYAAINLQDLHLAAVSAIYAVCCIVLIILTFAKRISSPGNRQADMIETRRPDSTNFLTSFGRLLPERVKTRTSTGSGRSALDPKHWMSAFGVSATAVLVLGADKLCLVHGGGERFSAADTLSRGLSPPDGSLPSPCRLWAPIDASRLSNVFSNSPSQRTIRVFIDF